jgi:transposase
MALAQTHPDWLVGFQDETWWSRTSRPGLASWSAAGHPLQLVEGSVPSDDPDPKALACYGLWLPEQAETWLRFVDGRPISAITTQFLTWCAEQAAQVPGIRRLVLIWDNASWHTSGIVREAVRTHNQQVQRTGSGVTLVPCPLPSQSPWLNPIEPKWLHAKRQIVEPERVLSLAEVEERVCQALACPKYDHLSLSNDVP